MQSLHADDAVQVMWRLAVDVMEATQGRKYWVGHIGNAMQLAWGGRGGLAEQATTIPTPEGPEIVKLVLDVSNRVAVRPPSVGERA